MVTSCAIGAAGFLLGVVLHVTDQPVVGAWTTGSSADFMCGTGFIAVAHDAYLRARLQGAVASAAHDERST